MGEYFRFLLRFFRSLEWRPKIGIAVLIMTLVCMGAWLRSLGIEDEISLSFFGRLHVCDSAIGNIRWISWDDHGWLQGIEWHSDKIPVIRTEWNFILWESRLREADNTATIWGFTFQHGLRKRVIPYWSIVLPLSLISAYLLLVKPRPQTVKLAAQKI